MDIVISKSLSLPTDAVTQTFGCIGRKGAGKTYLAGVLAEQMLNIRAQIIVLDPVGNWWGLRVDADGKSKGKNIFVIGGEHGDIPITVDSGAKIARVLVEKGVSAVLDISSFRQGERKRFAADFAEEFFHLKKTQRSACHVFVEEAQLFVPQRCGPEEARMLGAFENIIRLGRNYGIGATLISQRPQSVNKEVLSQVECLCVLQVNGAHERKALEEWVQEAGADRKLVGELPGLSRGEGFVWSPSWLRVFERVKFAKKTTFDASATPEVGVATKTALLSAVDVEGLKEQLKDIVDKANNNDPIFLRKQIADLEKRVNTMSQVRDAPDPGAVKEIVLAEVNRVLAKAHVGATAMVDCVREKLESAYDEASRWGKANHGPDAWKVETLTSESEKAIATIKTVPRVEVPRFAPRMERQKTAVNRGRGAVNNGNLTGPEQRILDAIAWFEQIGVQEPEQPAVAFMAGYTYGSGGYNNPRGRLKQRGLVEYLSGDHITLTEDGRAVANHPEIEPTNEALQSAVLAKLPGPEQRILTPLLECYPKGMDNERLAQTAGYTPGSGGYNNPRGRLRSLGLVEYKNSIVHARHILFPEGE